MFKADQHLISVQEASKEQARVETSQALDAAANPIEDEGAKSPAAIDIQPAIAERAAEKGPQASSDASMPSIRAHKLVLGFAHWGSARVPLADMLETVAYAVDNGVDEIDCAPHYGNGAQENVLGVALLALPEEKQAQIKISTKAGRVIDPNSASESRNGFSNASCFSQSFDYTKAGIEKSFYQSQLRMRLPKVHALYLHDLEEGIHYQPFVEDGHVAFDELKEQGKIEVAGIGSNDTEICIKLIKDGRFAIDRIMIAGCYNLLNFAALEELFPLCKERNIKLYVAAPYGGGILSGQPQNQFFRYAKANAEILEKLEKIKAVCAEFKVALPHAAMQFVHMHPQVERVVVGARTPQELKVSVEYAQEPIAPEFWQALKTKGLIPADTIVPPPSSLPTLSFFAKAKADKTTVVTSGIAPGSTT